MLLRTRCTLVQIGTVILLCGCGGESRNSADVTGKVTLNGAPLPNVVVRFQPVGTGNAGQMEAGMGSYGETDEQGTYVLRFVDNDSRGALIGEHTVTIDQRTPPEAEDADAGDIGEEPQTVVPPTWADGSQHFTVKEGTNTADFELSQ